MRTMSSCLALARIAAVATLASSLLVACGSAPVTRFHTLLAPPATAAAEASGPPIAWQLLPVTVPTQVDQPQLVVRAGDGTLALLENERWIAPLADEYRAALIDRLTVKLGPPSGGASGSGVDANKVWRLQVDVQRFDSQPGRAAREEASWALASGEAKSPRLECRSVVEQPVEAGYPALAAGHRQALARLADAIAIAARTLASGGTASCPALAAP